MKKRLKVLSLVLTGLTLCACQSQQPETKANPNTNASSTVTTASKADPKVVEDVKTLLAKHDKALNDKNIDAVMATFSTDPKTVVLGTGEGERFVGPQAIKEAYTEIFKDYDPGTLESTCDWKTGGADAAGTTAWLAATCQMKDSLKNVKREYVLNISGALEKQGNEWRFVMLHMSNATTGGPPPAADTQGEKAK
jgi:ketosteroid isomerase-like protein